jgi:hypothetical protein
MAHSYRFRCIVYRIQQAGNVLVTAIIKNIQLQQEDWLIRQINQLGRVLGKILADLLGLKTRGQLGEGIEAAEQTLKNELDLNIDVLIIIPTQEFQ